MRDIVAVEFVSLDGVVEAPEKWTGPYMDAEMGQTMEAGMEASDAMLLGRRTYQDFEAYWRDKTAEEEPYAPYINRTQKFVVSKTLTSVDWQNTTLITGNASEEIARLKGLPGKSITILGSPTLLGSLLRDGLVDRLELQLFPVVIGAGKRLFQDGQALPLELVGSRTFKTGIVALSYERAGA